jgi:hypothetical protein
VKAWLLVVALALSACGDALPPVECAAEAKAPGAALPCRNAVDVALTTLPPAHPKITKIQVEIGSIVPWACGSRPIPPGSDGTYACEVVVFTYDDASRQKVQVVLWDGALTAQSPVPD